MPGIAQNTSYLVGAYVVQKVLAFFYFVALARLLGPEAIGQYVFALSLATVFSVFLDFGFRAILVRAIAAGEPAARDLLRKTWRWVLVSSFLVVGGFIVWSRPWEGEVRGLSVALASLAIAADAVTLTIWSVFRGRQNLWFEARSFIVQYAVAIVFGLSAAALGWSVVFVVAASLAGSLTHMALAIFAAHKNPEIYPVVGESLTWRTALGLALPFALAALCSRGYNYLDVLFMTKLAGEEATGWYSAANKIYNALLFVPGALATALYPAMAASSENPDNLRRIFSQAVWYLFLITMPLMIWLSVMGSSLMQLLYGQEFLPTGQALQIMAPIFFFAWMGFVYNALLNATRHQTAATFNMAVALTVNIAVNLWLIPRWSFVGAAVAVVCSQVALFGLGTLWVRRLGMRLSRVEWQRIGKISLAGVLQFFVIWLLRDQLILGITISGFVFLAVIFGLKAVGEGEWRKAVVLYRRFRPERV